MWRDKLFPRDEWSAEKVLHLFNSQLGPTPRGKKSDYAELLERLSTGEIRAAYLFISCVRGPNCPRKGASPTPEWQLFRKCRHGGSDLHGWLKWWAFHWLSAQSAEVPKLESTIPGYGRADLYAEHLSKLVECGNTDPAHAMRFLSSGLSREFIVLPFQRAAIANTGQTCTQLLEAVSFSVASSQSIES